MSGKLHVMAAHVRELAAKHHAIAADMVAAKAATQGASWDVGVSHGAVCLAASTALYAANTARDRAAEAMRTTSEALHANLMAAAAAYDETDAQGSGALNRTIPPR